MMTTAVAIAAVSPPPAGTFAWLIANISYCSAPITVSLIHGIAKPKNCIIMPIPTTIGIEGTIENKALFFIVSVTTFLSMPMAFARLAALNKKTNDIIMITTAIIAPII